jgi:hypothetical protein
VLHCRITGVIDDQVVAPTIRERVTAAGLSDDTPAVAGRHT